MMLSKMNAGGEKQDSRPVETGACRPSSRRRGSQTTYWAIRFARLAMLILTGVMVFALGLVVNAAIGADYQALSTMLEGDIAGPIAPWQIVAMTVPILLIFSPLFYAMWTMHRFFGEFEIGERFGEATENALRRLGWSVIAFSIGAILLSPMAVYALTLGQPTGASYPFNGEITDAVLQPCFGLLMICVARLLSEARRVDDDNRQII